MNLISRQIFIFIFFTKTVLYQFDFLIANSTQLHPLHLYSDHEHFLWGTRSGGGGGGGQTLCKCFGKRTFTAAETAFASQV